jgi:hypothetical protein
MITVSGRAREKSCPLSKGCQSVLVRRNAALSSRYAAHGDHSLTAFAQENPPRRFSRDDKIGEAFKFTEGK